MFASHQKHLGKSVKRDTSDNKVGESLTGYWYVLTFETDDSGIFPPSQ